MPGPDPLDNIPLEFGPRFPDPEPEPKPEPERHKVITDWAFANAMIEAGVIREDDKVHRIVIDCRAGHAVKVYVERYGDDRLLQVIPALTGVEIRSGPG